jgi:hypothetical protein
MPFSDETLEVVACRHLIHDKRPVRLATHYSNGEWAFTCGRPDHGLAKDYQLVSVSELLATDPELGDIADLPEGWSADRGGEPLAWYRYEDPEADD